MAWDRKTSIGLNADLWRRVRMRAAQEDAPIKEVLERALRAYLKTKPRPRKEKR